MLLLIKGIVLVASMLIGRFVEDKLYGLFSTLV
jgi:hypothetical protein